MPKAKAKSKSSTEMKALLVKKMKNNKDDNVYVGRNNYGLII